MQIPFVDLKPQYQALKPDITQAIERVLEHGQFVMGPEVEAFEAELTAYTGARALAVASGTDALMLALLACEPAPGDEVITTAFSFFATAGVIALLGLTPVFVDIDPVTYNLDPEKVKAAITGKTKAILPVSLYGQPPAMDEINQIARAHGLSVIEDGAQSFGATYGGKKSCNLSELGCTSFFPAKPLGGYGDGGAVFTNNDELFEKLKSLRNHGQSQRYLHERVGFNGRLDTLQCAILSQKLKRYPWEVEQRQKIAAIYSGELAPLEGVITLPHVREGATSVWAQYTLRVPSRDQLQERLKEKGVPTAIHYPMAMHHQPALRHLSQAQSLEQSEKAAKEVLSLPLYADMPLEHVQHVVKSLQECLSS